MGAWGGGALEGGRGDRTGKPGGNLDGFSGAGSVLLAKERLRAFCLFFDSFNIRVLAGHLPRARFMPPTGSPVSLFSVGNPYQERRPPARPPWALVRLCPTPAGADGRPEEPPPTVFRMSQQPSPVSLSGLTQRPSSTGCRSQKRNKSACFQSPKHVLFNEASRKGPFCFGN